VKKRFIVFISMIALMGLLALPTVASASTTLTDLEKQVVTLVNQKRAAHGLVELKISGTLVRAARSHSREMGSKQYFGHPSYGGESFSHRLVRLGYTREGYSYWAAGENIAWGSGLDGTAEATVNAWMKSKAHRAVILHAKFRELGIGAVVCSDGYGDCDNPVTFFTLDLGRRVK
jgi:uncharacterized protein YkwD